MVGYLLSYLVLLLMLYYLLLQILHAREANKNAFKALIVAKYTGVKIEVSENFAMGVSNKTLEFIKMNPLGKVSGGLLYKYDSNSIMVLKQFVLSFRFLFWKPQMEPSSKAMM